MNVSINQHDRVFSPICAALAALGLMACFIMGCATSAPAAREGEERTVAVGKAPGGKSVSAARELATAQRMIKAGESSLVIPRLQSLVNAYPGDTSAIEARFFLGKAYYNVGAYTDSLRWLKEYMDLAPAGENTGEGRELVQKMTSEGGSPAPLGEDEQQIAKLEAAVAADPDAMAPRLELANFLWEKSLYEKAGPVYAELIRRWPQLESDMAIRRRVGRDKMGNIVAMTPAEMERRYHEEEPLLIYNVSSFRSGRFEGWPATAQEKYYNVAGQAVNQSETPLEDVRVIVTIYGFGQMVYDTQTISLGTLRPREVRAFNAQFSRFDNIHNITRHECTGTYRR